MSDKHKRLVPWVLSLAVAISGCGGESSDSSAADKAPTSEPEVSDESSLQIPDAREVVGQSMTLGNRQSVSRLVDVYADEGKQWQPYERAPEYTHAVAIENQTITMSDGTQLFAKVTLPGFGAGEPAEGSFPVVLTQTSYNTSFGQFAPQMGGANEFLIKRGYAHVVVDVRGTGNSGGSWGAFDEREQQDYLEVLNWIVQQDWAQDRIGLEGISYLGITSVLTAQHNHPAVKAAFPIVPIGDGYRDIVFTGGNVNATFIPLWLGMVTGFGLIPAEMATVDPEAALKALPERLYGALAGFQVPTIVKALAGEPETAYDGDFWAIRSPLEGADKINVPTFIVGGLFDLFQRSEPLWFEQLNGRVDTKLLIGPWNHIEAAGVEFLGGGEASQHAVPDLDTLRLQWFDEYVMGLDTDVQKQPDVTQYVLGLDEYDTTSHWPHPDMQADRFYLSPAEGFAAVGQLQPQAPEEAENTLVAQHLLNGLCSSSLDQWTAGLGGMLPLPCAQDNSFAELAAAKYELPAGEEGLYLNGPMQADLWVSTTAKDVQVSVRLDIVNPNGTTTPVTNGLMTAGLNSVDETRSRFVNGEMIQPWHTFRLDDVQPYEPGEVRKVSVEIFASSAYVPPGSSLRVSVNTSNIAQGLPPLLTALNSLLGVMTLHTGPETPSSVVLPVVPSAKLDSMQAP
ncbi:CocE/NonD family hydrolase [Marinobacter litoralis]|uniref:CocE/NonD family hydrolase n=1 Tax=Marinobacter litoralis TaxID=187981 RepID=UPI0018ECE9E5|nr:CocE/NonD family hydrolase [Marinobacter litoralis]MBJ6138608.1 CocE/NonD family hydrolase [Marinobacter litoralis]